MKIEQIELFPVNYPMTGYFKFFSGPKTAPGRSAILIKVTADNGAIGWGQSVPVAKWSDETPETALVALRLYYAPALLGHDPLDLVGAHARLDQAIAPGFSTGMPITRAGLDLALHDLSGRIQGLSLAEQWERSPGGPVTLSWTVNVQRPDEAEAVMEEGWRRGYRHFNIKVGGDLESDVDLARRVKQRAPHGFLWADANGGYTLETALKAAPRLADAGVAVLESPLRPNCLSGYQALKRQGALPIVMDEGVVSPRDLREFIGLGMLDGVALKPARCGGLISARAQIEMAVAEGLIWLGSGLTDPDLGLAAALALYSAYGLSRPAALNGPQFLTEQMLKTPLRIVDGIAEVPTGPGLGVEVDEDNVRDRATDCISLNSN